MTISEPRNESLTMTEVSGPIHAETESQARSISRATEAEISRGQERCLIELTPPVSGRSQATTSPNQDETKALPNASSKKKKD